MLYIGWMVILCGHDIKHISFGNFDFEPPTVKNRMSRLCIGPFTQVSHDWWKQSFRVFGTRFDRPLAILCCVPDPVSYGINTPLSPWTGPCVCYQTEATLVTQAYKPWWVEWPGTAC